jgi:hypothetical protein
MDYLFRWLELRFLKSEQGLLFELPRPAQPQREVTSVVEGLGQVAELGECTPLPILRLTDGEKRVLQSVHGMWQHERLLIN